MLANSAVASELAQWGLVDYGVATAIVEVCAFAHLGGLQSRDVVEIFELEVIRSQRSRWADEEWLLR